MDIFYLRIGLLLLLTYSFIDFTTSTTTISPSYKLRGGGHPRTLAENSFGPSPSKRARRQPSKNSPLLQTKHSIPQEKVEVRRDFSESQKAFAREALEFVMRDLPDKVVDCELISEEKEPTPKGDFYCLHIKAQTRNAKFPKYGLCHLEFAVVVNVPNGSTTKTKFALGDITIQTKLSKTFSKLKKKMNEKLERDERLKMLST